jgi:hypothetical protein
MPAVAHRIWTPTSPGLPHAPITSAGFALPGNIWAGACRPVRVEAEIKLPKLVLAACTGQRRPTAADFINRHLHHMTVSTCKFNMRVGVVLAAFSGRFSPCHRPRAELRTTMRPTQATLSSAHRPLSRGLPWLASSCRRLMRRQPTNGVSQCPSWR